MVAVKHFQRDFTLLKYLRKNWLKSYCQRYDIYFQYLHHLVSFCTLIFYNINCNK